MELDLQVQNAQVFYKFKERFVPWPTPPALLPTNKLHIEDMFASLTCDPPLGCPSVVHAKITSLAFRACIECDAANQADWQLQLWHNAAAETEWAAADFKELTCRLPILSVSSDSAALPSNRRYFYLELPRPSDVSRSEIQFTIKFRKGTESPWSWARDQFGHTNGRLLLQPRDFPTHDLSQFIDGVDPNITVQQTASDTPDTLLWKLEAPVKAANGEESGWATHRLGIPKHFDRWFAVTRLFHVWLLPRHGRTKFEVDKDAIFTAFLRKDGLSLVAVALSGLTDVSSVFKHDSEGNVNLHSRNDSPSQDRMRVLISVGRSFEEAASAAMYEARKIATQYFPVEDGMAAVDLNGPDASWIQSWTDGFAYCTWNSLGQDLTEDKIFEALESFKKNDISITCLIIDDNWQSLDNEGKPQDQRGMTRFEANEKGFPNGLASTIGKIRHDHPNIQHVAVWHTMMGYWGAMSPEGQIAKDYQTVEVANPRGGKWTVVAHKDVGRYYDDFYRFLRSCGVDGVKNDAQNMLDDLPHAPDRRALIKAYQDAWTLGILRHFEAKAISCGSQAPVLFYHSMIQITRPRILVRNSDDFFPQIDSSHTWHIFCNAHNSLFAQYLHIMPDWDMFQTDHPWARYHAAARCISGGPIYITDSPGKHDKALIKQMVAKTPHGITVILRPPLVGKSSSAYVGYDEPRLLKVDNYVGMSRWGVSLLGVFNVGQLPLAEVLTLNDFPGTETGTYILRSHVTGKVSPPMMRGSPDAMLHVSLGLKGYDIISAFPLHRHETRYGPVTVANLGLVDKMVGAAAIVNDQVNVTETGSDPGRVKVSASLKAFGTLGIYIEDLKSRSVANDLMGMMFDRPIPLNCVRVSPRDENVLEVDLEKAWEQGNQTPYWGNEIPVEIFVK